MPQPPQVPQPPQPLLSPQPPRLLTVGRIPFLVCAPFFHQSLQGFPGSQFRDGPPSAQNLWLRQGVVDMSPTSSLEYALSPGEYFILPGLCTAGRLEIRSVRLFAKRPWRELHGQCVLLSAASATSNALFQVLSRQYHGVEPRLLNPPLSRSVPSVGERSENNIEGMVAIGDDALGLLHSPEWPHQYDLAAEWQAWQHLPFAFGLWLVRRKAALEKTAAVRAYARHIHEAVADFRRRPEAALSLWLKAYPNSLPLSEMLEFYAAADYAFTPQHGESLRRFFALAFAQNLVPENPELRFFQEPS